MGGLHPPKTPLLQELFNLYNKMGIFNEQSFDHPFAKGIPGAPGVGFSLTQMEIMI